MFARSVYIRVKPNSVAAFNTPMKFPVRPSTRSLLTPRPEAVTFVGGEPGPPSL